MRKLPSGPETKKEFSMPSQPEVAQAYTELRNILAKSHPQPNMRFEIGFLLAEKSLLIFSSVSKKSLEIAKIQPHYFNLFIPHFCAFGEAYAFSLLKYVNRRLSFESEKEAREQIIYLCHQHRKTLGLGPKYDRKDPQRGCEFPQTPL